MVDLTPKQSSKPPKLKREALLNQWRCSQFLECQAPPHKRKPPYRKLSSDRSVAYSSFVHKKPNLTQMKQEFKYFRAQWHAQNFGWVKMFDFRRATIFCLRCCLLKHKMTRYSQNLEGPWPPAPPLATPMYVRFM